MKKINVIKILAFFLFISNNCLAQPNNDLQKYSYILIARQGEKAIGNATCFFVKHCGKVYVVSNFHALLDRYTNYSPLKEIIFDNILIRHEGKIKGEWAYTKLKVSDLYNDALRRTNNFRIQLRIDAWCYQIESLSGFPLNFVDIEDNSSHYPLINNGTKSIIYGFPASDYKNENNYNKRIARNRIGALNSYSNEPIGKGSSNFYVDCKAEGGFSGSPIFSYYEKNKKHVVKFTGILYADGGENANSLNIMGWKADVIITQLFRPCN